MGKKLIDSTLFKGFCTLKCDRKKYLIKILMAKNIPYKVLKINGASHLLLFPENLKTGSTALLAHYDRVVGTPGANDNSASVFYLYNHALKLLNKKHDTIIIFTDKEEIGNEESVKEQGAYGLGNYLKSNNINLNFYIFDMCGIGTTLLLGTAGENLIKEKYGNNYEKSEIKGKIDKSKSVGESVLLSSNYGEFFYLTPLFSDDLGLILNGFSSILISLLPYREAVEYKKNNKLLPNSWRCNHKINDDITTLDHKSHVIISPILEKLSGIYIETKDKKSIDSFKCYTQKVKEKTYKKPKPLRSYILKPRIDIGSIKTNNINRLEIFRLLISKTSPDTLDLFNMLIENIKSDIHYSIYNYIKEKVSKEFRLLPISFKTQIINIVKSSNEDEITNFLFKNTINNIGNKLEPDVTPNNKKVHVSFIIQKLKPSKYLYKLKTDNTLIGTIYFTKEDNNLTLSGGDFNPDEILKLDSLNLLKGVRTTLIKWAKLNNNKSLKIDLSVEKWIGCYTLLNLLTMELEGRSNTIWREYNGS